MSGRKTFSKEKRRTIFEKLYQIPGEDPNLWRKDRNKRKIYFPAYGDYNSRFGWNIHHINGNSKDNNIINLEAVNYVTHEELH